MEKQELIRLVRELASQAKPKQALEVLLPFLQSDVAYKDLAKIAYVAQSKLERNRRERDGGTITRENAHLTENLVTRTIINLTNDLEHNNHHPKRYEIQGNRLSTRLVWILTGIFALLAIGLGTWIYSNFFDSKTPIVTPAECPTFDKNSTFNILLLPFETIAGTNLKTHISIKRRLADMVDRFGVRVDIEIFKNYFDNDAHDTPTTTDAR
ncbi:MAG: hypothetical protein AAGK47_03280, partial [Bacteroidota bacterium]